MNHTTIKARLFTSHECYENRFNYFTLYYPDYERVLIEQIVMKNNHQCYEFNTMCQLLQNALKVDPNYISNELYKIKFVETKDNSFYFYDEHFKDWTSKFPKYILNELTLNKNIIYRHRYKIHEDFVVQREGFMKNKNNVEIVKDRIFTQKDFLERFGVLPERSHCFKTLDIKGK